MKTRREFVEKTSKSALGMSLAPLAPSPETSVAGTGTGLVAHKLYEMHELGPDHVESPARLERIHSMFKARGLDQEMVSIAHIDEPMSQIEAHHTKAHVASIRKLPVTGDVAAAAVGGALAAIDAVAEQRVRNAFCAVRPPGHHANNTGAEEGFCFYSNAAIAAKYAQSKGFEKVLVIDWDYHHGNGTQNAFYDDPSVLFFSSHDWQAYPGTGDPSLAGKGDGTGLNINVHLECGSKDKDMLDAWDKRLLPVAEKFAPDFIVISAGFDSRQDDPLGCFDVTDDAFSRMTKTTMDVARRHCGGRIVSMLEGGYNVDGLARGAAAHVEALLTS